MSGSSGRSSSFIARDSAHTTPQQREIYENCDEVRTYPPIAAFVEQRLGAGSGFETSLREFLDQLTGFQIMVREGGSYLSLAVNRGNLPWRQAAAAGF